MRGEAARSLHPLVSLAAAACSLAAAYSGFRLEALAFGLALTLASPASTGLLKLYAWLAAPVSVVAAATRGPWAAVDSVVGVLSVAAPVSAALTLTPPRWLAWLLWKLGLPPLAAYSPVFTLRLANHLSAMLGETLQALRGRGVTGGARLALRAPVPVVVQAFQSTVTVAEALYFKAPRRGKSWVESPRLGPLDYAVLAVLAACAVVRALLPHPPLP